MSGAQPPPRTRMRRPLMRKSRPPFGVISAVISRIPKRMCCRSETFPPTMNSRSRSYVSGLPSSAGHHKRGLATRSCGKLSGVKRTSALSRGPSVIARLNATPASRPSATRPRSVPVTDRDERFLTSATTVSSARRSVAVSTWLTTSGYRTVTSPVAVRWTGCQSPMSLSGGDGFQSTQVVCKSGGVGAKISTASTLAAVGENTSVTSSS